MRPLKILVHFYIFQMIFGLAIGFALPWLRFWSII